jgi:hypothetical protein
MTAMTARAREIIAIECEDDGEVRALLRDFAVHVRGWQKDLNFRGPATDEVEQEVLKVVRCLYDGASDGLKGTDEEVRASALRQMGDLIAVLNVQHCGG